MDFSFVTKEFFANLSPKEINNGNCFNWAYIVYLLNWENGKKEPYIQLYSDDMWTHAFIRIGDLYYDSEMPKGTDDYYKLPTYHRCDHGDPFEHDLSDFLYTWKRYGRYGKMLDLIPELLQNYFKKCAA